MTHYTQMEIPFPKESFELKATHEFDIKKEIASKFQKIVENPSVDKMRLLGIVEWALQQAV